MRDIRIYYMYIFTQTFIYIYYICAYKLKERASEDDLKRTSPRKEAIPHEVVTHVFRTQNCQKNTWETLLFEKKCEA